jgi:cytochrome b involved in lipid metabolism
MAPNKTSEMVGPEEDFHNQGAEERSPNIKEILCDGYYYDVTNFVRKHPGGSIIDYYTQRGEDATHAIQQFHQRSSKKIDIMLKSFKKRPANDRHSRWKMDVKLSLISN